MTTYGPQTIGPALLLHGSAKYYKYPAVRRAVDMVLAAAEVASREIGERR